MTTSWLYPAWTTRPLIFASVDLSSSLCLPASERPVDCISRLLHEPEKITLSEVSLGKCKDEISSRNQRLTTGHGPGALSAIVLCIPLSVDEDLREPGAP